MAMSIQARSVVVAATLMAVTMVLALAGCGGSSTSGNATPAPTASQSGLASTVAALKTYLGQVKPITSQVATTVGSLPAAVKGLSKKPDSTWTAAATKLDVIAGQLGGEAASLAALSPPAALQSVQAAVVKGIQGAKTEVTKRAGALSKRASASATRQAAIRSQIAALKTRLSGLTQSLTVAIGSLILSPDSTPSPSAP
jgi:hypothetical protein